MRKLCFLVLLLAVAVAAREVAEYLSLTDDVSNDGEISVYALDATLRISATRPSYCTGRHCDFTGSFRAKHNCFSSLFSLGAPATITGRTLLLLLSEQRK
jgi:hypothetical protein